MGGADHVFQRRQVNRLAVAEKYPEKRPDVRQLTDSVPTVPVR